MIIKPIESVMYGTVTFQNPEDKKTPYVVEVRIEPDQDELIVQSPLFNRIKNHKNYRVQFDLFETESRDKRLNKHVDKVKFLLPAAITSQMGIELL